MAERNGVNDGKYWIEEVQDRSNEDNDNNSQRIILSCEAHGACIEILGSRIASTNRAVRVLRALNETKE